ncbi:MAG: DUF742 domain-containing protein [Thermocrispum sp.]
MRPPEEEDESVDLVRPYVVAGDTALPQNSSGLLLITLVTTSDTSPPPLTSPEKLRLWEVCAKGYLSVAEAAGYVRLPLGIVKVLLSDLAESGHLLTRDPPPQAESIDSQVLQEVLNGLRSRFG